MSGSVLSNPVSNRPSARTPVVTSLLFEAYLSCPTKCFLLGAGATKAGNAYAAWDLERNRSYRDAGVKNLAARHNPKEVVRDVPFDASRALRKSGLTINAGAQVQKLETTFHAVEWIAEKQDSKADGTAVPVRFVAENKLSRTDKLLLAFDAHVLAKLLNHPVASARIVHGDDFRAHNVKISEVEREVKKFVGKIAALISGTDPPKLTLNRHCVECVFQERCRKLAVEKDDLSLLAALPAKERVKLNSKGIFSVTQLSYTFRPRRRFKRLTERPEKYHHALKALAIREKKIHIVGSPQFKIEGTPVFVDVEGLPDRDFYYLVGLRWTTTNGVEQRSVWADASRDEGKLWADFLDTLSTIKSATIIHYGSFETTFFKKMSARYGGPPEGSVAASAIVSAVNLLAVVFAQIYFPTYSNGLKDIASYLGFNWNDPLASGLQSIVWRHNWERFRDPALKGKLVRYNADDCEALSLVAAMINKCSRKADAHGGDKDANMVFADFLKHVGVWKDFSSPISGFERINNAAHWDYQRSRIFARPNKKTAKKTQRKRPRSHQPPVALAEKTVMLNSPLQCSKCGNLNRRRISSHSKVLTDLEFSPNCLRRTCIRYTWQTYRCIDCKIIYGIDERCARLQKYGWGVLAYFVYNIIGLCVTQYATLCNLNRFFGFDLLDHSLKKVFIRKASDYYLPSRNMILQQILKSHFIHVDETRANIRGRAAYVWVMTSAYEVVYLFNESREGEFIKELLKDFRGVLISDFYAAYDAIECSHQKCLIHLMRDINEDILRNPFAEDLKRIAHAFSTLLQLVVRSIDRHGLKKLYLQKHLAEVDQFYEFLSQLYPESEAAQKLQLRFQKNRDKLFTFLNYDGVSWHNNNAEHAIKGFAKLRDVVGGRLTVDSIERYLTLLSVCHTCKYHEIDFLDFLLSGEKDVTAFSGVTPE